MTVESKTGNTRNTTLHHARHAPEARSFRLTGAQEGMPWAHVLGAGESLVGQLPECDIRLPWRGVSRRHARLRWHSDDLMVEDLHSKNGTFVNGRRIERARLRPADEVRFGPVTLRLEEVHPGDTVLALTCPPAAAGTLTGEGDATDWLSETGSPEGGTLERLHELVELLLGEEQANLGGALRLVAEQARATGCVLLAWDGRGEPRVRGVWGAIEDLSRRHDLQALLLRLAGEPRPLCSTARLAGEPVVWCCAASEAGAETLIVLLFGAALAPREASALLGILARLLGRVYFGPPPTGRGRISCPGAALAKPEGFVRGASAAIRAVYLELEKVSGGEFPVLVVGETGVGKEHLVRLLHAGSDRHDGPFVAINCAAIPGELLEAEMFGVGRGVATGVQERKGRFQEAEGGILFLDEIADMPLPLQAKLLRALEAGTVQPLGGTPERVDVRIVAATNCDLKRRADAGVFRLDLYYRIAGFTLRVPPLRERREDLALLVQHFLGRSVKEAGKWITGVTLKALELMTNYPWPGNIRELEQEVRRLVYACPTGQPIDSSLLSEAIRSSASAKFDEPAGEPSLGIALGPRVQELESDLIRQALRAAGGSQSQAARLLGLSRNGLAKKLHRLGIDPRDERALPHRPEL
jgi:DNA-binding NtrC family response regulator